MIGWLTWRIGALILGGLLTAAAGGWLYDGVSKRAELATVYAVLQRTADQLKTANESNGICQANYRTIETALDRQGADIRDLAAKSDAAGKRAEEAAKAGAAARIAAQQAAQRVLDLPRPAPGMACEAAERILRGRM